jgi:acyl-CoA reductase-like NAD-dependent aldehyde dehydrogenase
MIGAMRTRQPLWLGSEPVTTASEIEVRDKWTGASAAAVAEADAGVIDRAIASAAGAARAMAELPAWRRQAILSHCVTRFTARRDELAELLIVEAGKTITDARTEVGRLIDTFRIAAEEAVRIGGEVLELQIAPRAEGYRGRWEWFPVGPVALIAPFNFPLNLAAHKIAPAIAAGCPLVLKPASQTPLGALAIGEVLAETELPRGAFSILPCRGEAALPLVTDPRIRLLSFTGSPAVGWELKARAGRKRVLLELGGNAAVLVDRDADLDDAVPRIVRGAFYQGGQSCISVQRILVHRDAYDRCRALLVDATRALRRGDPRDERTFQSPLITVAEAERVERWVGAAVARGARVLCGGERDGAFIAPAIVEDVPLDADLSCREVFGPVATLAPFDDFDAALAAVDASEYGLQAGLFTRDVHRIERAFRRLEVGAVIVDDVPAFRVDSMPYGGVKHSGLGREGPRWSIREMSEPRLLVLRGAR